MAGGAAGLRARLLPPAGHDDLELLPHQPLVDLSLDPLLEGEEALQALGGDSGSTAPSSRGAAVPGRGEYLKANRPAKRTSRTSSRVCSKSSSVSPGKPTMRSVESASSGRARRSCATRSRYSLPRVAPPHAAQHAVGARLHGQVQVGADVRVPPDLLHHPRREVARVGGDEAQPLHARQAGDRGRAGRRNRSPRPARASGSPSARAARSPGSRSRGGAGPRAGSRPSAGSARGRGSWGRCRRCSSCCTPR